MWWYFLTELCVPDEPNVRFWNKFFMHGKDASVRPMNKNMNQCQVWILHNNKHNTEENKQKDWEGELWVFVLPHKLSSSKFWQLHLGILLFKDGVGCIDITQVSFHSFYMIFTRCLSLFCSFPLVPPCGAFESPFDFGPPLF